MSSTPKPTTSARQRALELVADRWTLWLLTELDARKGARFSDLAGEPGLSRRVLTERLSTLVEEQVVAKEQYSARPPRYRYVLTGRGWQLQRLAVALVHVAAGGKLPDGAFVLPEGDAPTLGSGATPEAASTPPPVLDRSAASAHPADQLLATDPDAAWAIYQKSIAPLVRYDEQYRTPLAETLETYLQCDASVSVTAAKLYAHRHTIRYRLGRVRELTGLDVDTLADREQLVLGLRALRMFQRSGRELV